MAARWCNPHAHQRGLTHSQAATRRDTPIGPRQTNNQPTASTQPSQLPRRCCRRGTRESLQDNLLSPRPLSDGLLRHHPVTITTHAAGRQCVGAKSMQAPPKTRCQLEQAARPSWLFWSLGSCSRLGAAAYYSSCPRCRRISTQ